MPSKSQAAKAADSKNTKNTVEFGGLQIPIWPGDKKNPLIPELGAEIWYPEQQMKAIATALLGNISCLLVGETGTGKTSLIRQIAFLRKQPYIRVNLNGYTSPDELVGSKSARDGSTFFEDGVIIQAMRTGAVLVVDELNAATPDCMFIFHALLDDERKITLPTGEVVKPHPEFRFFATMNPDYEGTKSINRAFLDRFGVIIVETLAPDLEEKYLINNGASQVDANNMVLFANAYRAAYRDQKTMTFCSTRTLLQWNDLVKQGFTLEQAFLFAVLGKSRAEEKTAMIDVFSAQVKKSLELGKEGDKLVIVKKSELEQAEKTVNDAVSRAREADAERDKSMAAGLVELKARKRLKKERDQLKKTLQEVTGKLEGFTQLKSVLKKLRAEGIISEV